MTVDTNSFPFHQEEPRTNLLRDANRPPPFYSDACRIADERADRGERLTTDDVERIRQALAFRAWRRDCEDFNKHLVQVVNMLLPRVMVTMGPGGALDLEPVPPPPEVQATVELLSAMALQRAEWYGITLTNTPKQENPPA